MNTLVTTRFGRLEGEVHRGTRVFRGIPYARPPVEALRFRPPEPPESWNDVRKAHRYGPSAPQLGPANRLVRAMIGAAGSTQSQDCLYLNIWAPMTPGRPRPVMVWMHGGAFVMGSGSTPLYRGGRLAKRGDVIVVTINYRLGALGFLCGRALFGCRPEEGWSNLGLQDQIAALVWVRDNIEAFGGDPENVTLFGESAGAMSLGTLLGAPIARKLFHKVILQSGASHNVSTPAVAEQVARTFLETLRVEEPTPDLLRELSVSEIMRAQALTTARLGLTDGFLAWQPCIDGAIVPRTPLAQVTDGDTREIPMLIGTNRDEWKLFTTDVRLSLSALERRIQRKLPGLAGSARNLPERATEAYARPSSARSDSPVDRWSALQSDRLFHYPAMRLADLHSRTGGSTFSYLFDWSPPLMDRRLGACHGAELPFVFGLLSGPSPASVLGFSLASQRLSHRIQDAWIAFAKAGSPAHDGLPDWSPHSPERRSTMILGSQCVLSDDPHALARQVWERDLEDGPLEWSSEGWRRPGAA